jgi:hypothetical protein
VPLPVPHDAPSAPYPPNGLALSCVAPEIEITGGPNPSFKMATIFGPLCGVKCGSQPSSVRTCVEAINTASLTWSDNHSSKVRLDVVC